MDHISILVCCPSLRMTKLWRRDAEGILHREGYGHARHFRLFREPVEGFDKLAAVLDRMAGCPRACVIRGAPKPGVDPSLVLRRKVNFQPERHHWLMLDFDGVEDSLDVDPFEGDEGARYLRTLLPPPFHHARCWWSHTSSAGFAPGIRMRLAFWLDRPLSDKQLKQWLCSSPVDLSLFHEIQVHYVAAPVLVDVSDPIDQRFGVLDGEDSVTAPEITIKPPSKIFRRAQRFAFATSDRPYEAVLDKIASGIAATQPAGAHPWGGTGRHHALFCGALSATNLVRRYVGECNDLQKMAAFSKGVFSVLAAAGAKAGIAPDAEIERTINNAWRVGGLL